LTLPWRGPEFDGDFPSLGWALLELYEEYLRIPSGPQAGEPFRLSDDQATFTVRFYAVDPAVDRLLYRRGARRRAKGTGKSPHLGAFAFGELVGDVVFDGWDANGEPVGRPRDSPWGQIAACSEDQTDNTYLALLEMLAESAAIDEFGIDAGVTRIQLTNRFGRIDPVTASAGSREGQPITSAVLDETHLWTPRNGGKRLAATLRRNLAKMNGRSIDSTNAYVRGQDSVAEATDRAWKRGEAGLLYDCIEAPAVDDLRDRRKLRKALAVAYTGAPWVDLDRLIDEIADPETTANDARRFYLNQPVDEDNTESWLDDLPTDTFARCAALELELPDSGCVMAWDMSLRHDSTAIATLGRQDDRIVARVRIFSRDTTGKIDFLAVRQHIRTEALAHQVTAIGYDPRYLEFEAQELADGGLPMEEFPQSAERMGPACGLLRSTIATQTLAHDGGAELAEHVARAVKRETDRGFTLSKGKSPGPIDGCIVLAMGVALLEMVSTLPAADIF